MARLTAFLPKKEIFSETSALARSISCLTKTRISVLKSFKSPRNEVSEVAVFLIKVLNNTDFQRPHAQAPGIGLDYSPKLHSTRSQIFQAPCASFQLGSFPQAPAPWRP